MKMLHDLLKYMFLILQDFSRVVKYYNRIATALVKFEDLWISAWKSQIDTVKMGLKAPLLRLKGESKRIEINVDGRYVALFSDQIFLVQEEFKNN